MLTSAPRTEIPSISIQPRAADIKPGTTFTQDGATSIIGRTEDILAGTEDIIGRTTSIIGCTEDIIGGAEGIIGGTEEIIAGTEGIITGTTSIIGRTEGIIGGTTSIILSKIETLRCFAAKPRDKEAITHLTNQPVGLRDSSRDLSVRYPRMRRQLYVDPARVTELVWHALQGANR